tara:strand:- start:75 stop:548 length:474 start_codon:yes stop_codon:yes gene_type:complete
VKYKLLKNFIMALTDKKYTELYTSSKKTRIEAVHSENLLSHTADNPEDDPFLSSILKEIKDLQEEVDYLRTEISANKDKTGITSSQASAITANTAKTSFPGLGTTSTTALAGDTHLITLGSGTTYAFSDMIDNRGVFSIRITATNRGVTKRGEIRLT